MGYQQVLLLKNRIQYKQRSQEWYAVRKSLITASSAASLLIRDLKTCEPYVKEYDLQDIFDYNENCCNPYSSKKQYILDKCRQSKFKGNIATFWGQTYEPVVTDLYSLETGKEVLEFGLLIHPEYPWLGASPDGITQDGIMIEIKCPFRRKITGIPPLYYWIQVQLQLEVCDLEYCDFVEYEFTEFLTQEEFFDDDTLEIDILNKGMYIKIENKSVMDIPCNPEDLEYIYPDKDLLRNMDQLIKWKDDQLEILQKDKSKLTEIKPVFWKVCDKSTVRIKRDRKWFRDVRPVLEKEWKGLVYYQSDENYKKLLAKDKTYHEGDTLVLTDFQQQEMVNNYVFSDTEED